VDATAALHEAVSAQKPGLEGVLPLARVPAPARALLRARAQDDAAHRLAPPAEILAATGLLGDT